MRKVVIVNQCAGYLMADIADVFIESGKYDKVVLLVGNPDSVASMVNKCVKLDSFCPYIRTSMGSRFVSWIRGFFGLIRIIKKEYRDYDLFLVSNPPLVAFLPLFLNNNYTSLTYDLYPDGFLPSGKVTNRSLLFKVWSSFNKRYFKGAKGVFCITDGMADAMAKYCPRDRIQVVQLWGNDRIPVIDVSKKDNIFLKEHHLEDDFIISYSGNMGQGHDLLTLVDAMNKLKDLEKVKMLFIGDGYLKPILMDKVAEYGIMDKCIFFPYQPVEMLPFSFSCSDISVVSIHRLSVSMPSKTFDILRMGKPLLGIAETTSSLYTFIKENGIGEVFNRDESDKVAEFIRNAYNNSAFLTHYCEKSKACSAVFNKCLANKFIID